jgi:hypothetical protein
VVVIYEAYRSKGPRNGGCTSRLGLLLVEVLHLHYPSSLLSVCQLGHYRDQFSLPLVSDLVSILSLAALLI